MDRRRDGRESAPGGAPVDDPAAENDWIARASARLAFYAAIVGATLGGQVVGIGADALLRTRTLWLPYACSVLLEGIVGARAAGRRLDLRESARISIGYSAATVIVSTILVAWTDVAHTAGTPRLSLAGAAGFVPRVFLAVVLGTLARAGIMTGLSSLSARGR
jgi:predicted neutral ceramidase superfamily lipid hydrolase